MITKFSLLVQLLLYYDVRRTFVDERKSSTNVRRGSQFLIPVFLIHLLHCSHFGSEVWLLSLLLLGYRALCQQRLPIITMQVCTTLDKIDFHLGCTWTYVDVRPRTSTYIDIRRRTSTYVHVRRRTSTYMDVRLRLPVVRPSSVVARILKPENTITLALH